MRRKAQITLQDLFYIVMIVWMLISIIAVATQLFIVWHHLSRGDYNVTMPLTVGISLPVA